MFHNDFKRDLEQITVSHALLTKTRKRLEKVRQDQPSISSSLPPSGQFSSDREGLELTFRPKTKRRRVLPFVAVGLMLLVSVSFIVFQLNPNLFNLFLQDKSEESLPEEKEDKFEGGDIYQYESYESLLSVLQEVWVRANDGYSFSGEKAAHSGINASLVALNKRIPNTYNYLDINTNPDQYAYQMVNQGDSLTNASQENALGYPYPVIQIGNVLVYFDEQSWSTIIVDITIPQSPVELKRIPFRKDADFLKSILYDERTQSLILVYENSEYPFVDDTFTGTWNGNSHIELSTLVDIYNLKSSSLPKLTAQFAQSGSLLSATIERGCLYLGTSQLLTNASLSTQNYKLPQFGFSGQASQELKVKDIYGIDPDHADSMMVLSALDLLSPGSAQTRGIIGSGLSLYFAPGKAYITGNRFGSEKNSPAIVQSEATTTSSWEETGFTSETGFSTTAMATQFYENDRQDPELWQTEILYFNLLGKQITPGKSRSLEGRFYESGSFVLNESYVGLATLIPKGGGYEANIQTFTPALEVIDNHLIQDMNVDFAVRFEESKVYCYLSRTPQEELTSIIPLAISAEGKMEEEEAITLPFELLQLTPLFKGYYYISTVTKEQRSDFIGKVFTIDSLEILLSTEQIDIPSSWTYQNRFLLKNDSGYFAILKPYDNLIVGRFLDSGEVKYTEYELNTNISSGILLKQNLFYFTSESDLPQLINIESLLSTPNLSY